MVKIKKQLFAWQWSRFGSRHLREPLHPYKLILFESLKDLISSDPFLASKNKIRILEVGAGNGTNFEYYPYNCHLTLVEPNPYFNKSLDFSLSQHSDMILDKMVIGVAEDMKEIDSETMDVVISTLVLCSVKHVKEALEEIKRVLVPTGKFYYLEHIPSERGSWLYKHQRIAEPFSKLIGDGCTLTKDLRLYVNKAGFSQVNERSVIVEGVCYLAKIHLMGIATK